MKIKKILLSIIMLSQIFIVSVQAKENLSINSIQNIKSENTINDSFTIGSVNNKKPCVFACDFTTTNNNVRICSIYFNTERARNFVIILKDANDNILSFKSFFEAGKLDLNGNKQGVEKIELKLNLISYEKYKIEVENLDFIPVNGKIILQI